jgi:hypothetical protein
MLPLPRFATRRWFFGLLALLHVYMGGGHLLHLFQEPMWWTDTWKGLGAIFGAYYFMALALRRSARPNLAPRASAELQIHKGEFSGT